MAVEFEIVPIVPFEDGVAFGRKLGGAKLRKEIKDTLAHASLKDSLGAMSRASLEKLALAKLNAPPDFTRFPELADLYPERVDYLRGVAKGAGCTLGEAAVHSYALFRKRNEFWHASVACDRTPQDLGRCSGVAMVGADGTIGFHSMESNPPPKPRGYRHRAPKPFKGFKQVAAKAKTWKLHKPRTGYVVDWGATNERGVGAICGVSCSTHLDDPIADTWPCNDVPLLRFAGSVQQLQELWARYTEHNFGRASMIFGDTAPGGGDAVVVEKSFRRVGFRRLNGKQAIWCTEGYFETPEMQSFINARRNQFIERTGRHLGCEDRQYFTDCAVRFTRIGELCHMPWGFGLEHLRRIVTDHATFPRAVCRHGGPDTAAYDQSVTMQSVIYDLTKNQMLVRKWVPWKKWCCEVPEEVTQGPPRP